MMSNPGVFAVARGVFDHPLFDDDKPFSRREAWLWMVSEAAWKDRRVDVGGRIVELKRGQLAHSVRYLARAWNWSKSAVDRFLARLKTETMIGTDSGTAVAVITICKYDEYQRVGLPDRDDERDADRDGSGTAAGQKRNIETLKEDILSETDVSVASKSSRKKTSYPAEFEASWQAYPTDPNMSKAKAFAAWSKLDLEDRGKVAAGIPGFVAYCRKDAKYRPVHFERFIRDRRFDGFVESAVPARMLSVEDWEKRLAYARAERKWSTPQWGPMPRRPGCIVPEAMLMAGDGDGWQESERRVA